jgi:hypothetical protein
MAVNKRLLQGATGGGALTPSENFKVVTYTGNGGTQAITGVGFQPDMIWIKERSAADSHRLLDSTRGVNSRLFPDLTNAASVVSGTLNSFDSDGFTLGSAPEVNQNGETYVAWCWKSGGGTTSSNTDGNITSTVQANTAAGFSIVKYDGGDISSSTSTVGHGLDSAPELIIVKTYETGLTASEWFVYSQEVGNTKEGNLNQNAAFGTDTDRWNSTSPTSSVFTLGSSWSDYPAYYAGDTIAYCFHSVEGYSKFGGYTGNGSANGPIVETGFEPAFLMIKNTSDTGDWVIFDNKRNLTNPRNNRLMANLDSAESTGSTTRVIDFLSNGFTIKSTHQDINANNDTYIYMAFAADPDTEAPTLASSFNIETYTGTGAARSISGLGFGPGLVWTKDRGNAEQHQLHDIVRGATKAIASNLSNAEATRADGLTSFDSDGFSLGSDGAGIINDSSRGPYVAWTWKADDNEPTIFGGPARAVYKFEDNANDVTGSFNGTASNVTYSSSGKFNKAGDFSTSGANIAIGSPIPNTDTAVSVSAWVYLNSSGNTNDNGTVIGTGITSAGSEGPFRVNLRYVSANTYKITALRQVGGTYYLSADSNIIDSTVTHATWHHVVWTYSPSGRTLTTYLNGSKVQSTEMTTSGSSVNDSTSVIGNFRGNTTTNFNGLIDQVRIYNGVVSDDGVAELYAESTSQNDDIELGGPPKSIVSANANAGFSIVDWQQIPATGTTVPHGLSAAPNMIITKAQNDTDNWYVYHSALGTGKFMYLNLTNAQVSNAGGYSAVGASTFTSNLSNNSGINMISYCFHDIAGYQKFGSYTGSGSAGNAQNVGFQPDFLMFRRYNNSDNWVIVDTRRTEDKYLLADTTDTEQSLDILDFTSTGWTFKGSSMNSSSDNYIYWAIAKNVPSNTTLANSFKAVTYTGNGGTQSITGLGFKPDLVWIKHRNEADDHVVTDSIRGRGLLYANGTDAQNQDSQLTSFDSDGFSLAYNTGQNVKFNKSGGTYVAWCWKAGNTWQSNIDGTIPSTVNANTANGFSIVKYTGNDTVNATVGHGLGVQPRLVIVKRLIGGYNWMVGYLNDSDEQHSLYLNTDAARDNELTRSPQTFTTSTFKLGSVADDHINGNGNEYIAYCFASKSGYSKIGTYTGNGSTQSITGLGFQPDFVMIKGVSSGGAGDWYIFDSERNAQNYLRANLSNAESTGASSTLTSFDSDGFSLGNDGFLNGNTYTYLYMAFKMN